MRSPSDATVASLSILKNMQIKVANTNKIYFRQYLGNYYKLVQVTCLDPCLESGPTRH